jgi:hypothetical protein
VNSIKGKPPRFDLSAPIIKKELSGMNRRSTNGVKVTDGTGGLAPMADKETIKQ